MNIHWNTVNCLICVFSGLTAPARSISILGLKIVYSVTDMGSLHGTHNKALRNHVTCPLKAVDTWTTYCTCNQAGTPCSVWNPFGALRFYRVTKPQHKCGFPYLYCSLLSVLTFPHTRNRRCSLCRHDVNNSEGGLMLWKIDLDANIWQRGVCLALCQIWVKLTDTLGSFLEGYLKATPFQISYNISYFPINRMCFFYLHLSK